MYDADSKIWNWVRWCWSGEGVGNMPVVHKADDKVSFVNDFQAELVNRIFERLSHIARMVIIAEYPQRRKMFEGLNARERQARARRWIGQATGKWVSATEYETHLGEFKQAVTREVA